MQVLICCYRLIPLIVIGDDVQKTQEHGIKTNDSIVITSPVFTITENNQFTNTKQTLTKFSSNLNSKKNKDITNSLALPPVYTFADKFITLSPIHTIITYYSNKLSEHVKIGDRYTKNRHTLNNINTNFKSLMYSKYKEDGQRKVPGAELTFNFFINNVRKKIHRNDTVRVKNTSAYEMVNTTEDSRNFTYTKTHESEIREEIVTKHKKITTSKEDILNQLSAIDDKFGNMNNSKPITNNTEHNTNKTSKYRAKNSLIDGIIRKYINIILNNITLNGTNNGQQNQTCKFSLLNNT